MHRPSPIPPHPHPPPRLQVNHPGVALTSGLFPCLLIIWRRPGGGVVQGKPLPVPARMPPGKPFGLRRRAEKDPVAAYPHHHIDPSLGRQRLDEHRGAEATVCLRRGLAGRDGMRCLFLGLHPLSDLFLGHLSSILVGGHPPGIQEHRPQGRRCTLRFRQEGQQGIGVPHGHRLSPGGRVGLVDVSPVLQADGEGAGMGHRIRPVAGRGASEGAEGGGKKGLGGGRWRAGNRGWH